MYIELIGVMQLLCICLQTGTWHYEVTTTVQQTIVVSATSQSVNPLDPVITVNAFWAKDKYPHVLPTDPQAIVAFVSKGKGSSN